MKFKFQFPGESHPSVINHHSIEDATDWVCQQYNCDEADFDIWDAN